MCVDFVLCQPFIEQNLHIVLQERLLWGNNTWIMIWDMKVDVTKINNNEGK